MKKFLIALALGWASTLPASGHGVRIVDVAGDKVFPDIQTAVNAAVAGDILLVAGGTYPGFSVGGKGVSIIARPGDSVAITGSVSVSGVPAGESAWILGMSVVPNGTAWALGVASNAGAVRIADCFFRGTDSTGYLNAGQVGAYVSDSKDVAFVNCQFSGGNGESGASYSDGGDGVVVSGSNVALYQCQATGGKGGDWAYDAGFGGDGAELAGNTNLFAAGSTFRGGMGGSVSTGTGVPAAGAGGTALYVNQTCNASLLSNSYHAGPGGICWGGGWCIEGGAGGTVAGNGTAVQHPGVARSFACSRILSDDKPLTLAAQAQVGDQIHALLAATPAHVASVAPPGVWLVRKLLLWPGVPLGTHPTAGYPLAVPAVTGRPERNARRDWLQGCVVDVGGTQHIANPMFVLTLARHAQPDCNGNGINDFVDVVENKSLDLNSNLIPDSCE